MTLHFLNDVTNNAESTQIENYVIIASLKTETVGKLKNRIPGSCLLISSLPGSALRTHVVCSASLAMSTRVLKALPGKLDIKRLSPCICYVSNQKGESISIHRVNQLLEKILHAN